MAGNKANTQEGITNSEDSKKLTEKQKKFCEEYLVDLNALQAAIRAGYSEKTAGAIGHENLNKPEIQLYIQARQKKLQSNTGITQERVLQEYARIAFADPRRFFLDDGSLREVTTLDDNEAAILSSIETEKEALKDGDKLVGETVTKKIKFWDKLKALEALGKHLGIFDKDNAQKKMELMLPTININVPK